MGPFGHQSLNYYTLAGGLPPDNWAAYSGMPGGPAVQMVAGMLGDSWAQKSGMVNFGYQTHQNAYDMMKQKALYHRNRQVLQAASTADRASFEQTISGAFRMAGVDMTDPARIAEVQKMSGTVASMSGHLAAVAPELMDAMHGPRGSAAVMAHYMTAAGRYQIDPVTGMVGMSGQSVADRANMVHQMLYSGDNYMGMKGVKAGEAGRMYDEFVRRGMMSQPMTGRQLTRGLLSHMASQGTLENAYDAAGITRGTDIRDLSPSQVQRLESVQSVQDARHDPTAIAAANAKNISSKLKDWSGAVSAMKEIFGDAGHPNAPMPEIINALEQMTGGTMQQMSPARVEGLVRKMRNLANTSGMSMEATMQLMQTVQGMQQKVGFGNNEAAFSADIAMSSMAFRGGMDLSNPAWGRSHIDALTMSDAQLREQARGSMYTNHMSVIARLGIGTGVFQGKEGAQARELIAAMHGPNRNDQRVMQLMRQHGLTDESQLTSWLTAQSGGRLGADQVATMLADQHGNQEYANRFRLQDITRQAMFGEEVSPVMTDSFAGAFSGKLDDAGSAEAGRVMMKALTSMKEEGFNMNNVQQRTAFVAKALMKQAESNPALAGLRGKSIAEVQAMVETSWSAGSETAQNDFGMSIADVFALHDSAALEQGENRQASAEREALLQSSVAHVGKGTLMEKVISAFQGLQGKSADEIKKGIGAVLGNVDPAKLQPLMGALQHYQSEFDKLSSSPEYVAAKAEMDLIDSQISDAHAANDIDKVKALQDKRDELMSGSNGRFMRMGAQLHGEIDRVTQIAKEAGFDLTKGEPAAKPDPASSVTVTFPEDGVKIAGTITINDGRQPTLDGSMQNAGAAPNAAQGGVTT